jgi:hypothetical protein
MSTSTPVIAPAPAAVENDEAIVAALREAAGTEHVRSRLGVDPESGAERLAPGYRRIAGLFVGEGGKPTHGYQFLNDRGQTCQVPGHRVDGPAGVPRRPAPRGDA